MLVLKVAANNDGGTLRKAPSSAFCRLLLSFLLLEGANFCYLTSPCLANYCSSFIATCGGDLLLQKSPIVVRAKGEPLGRYFEVVEAMENIGERLSQVEVLLEGFLHQYCI
eukprot:Gb_05448 [translate_table: standard]